MLPDFTDDGLLPAGIHHATFREFEQRFVYFAHSDRRFRLFEKLRELYQHARQSGIVQRFLVVGSFVAAKGEPNDFDCILILDGTVVDRELRPAEYNLVARQRARRIYGGDIIAVVEGSTAYYEFMDLFQTTRKQGRVGMVRSNYEREHTSSSGNRSCNEVDGLSIRRRRSAIAKESETFCIPGRIAARGIAPHACRDRSVTRASQAHAGDISNAPPRGDYFEPNRSRPN
jgi:hypothetical protein